MKTGLANDASVPFRLGSWHVDPQQKTLYCQQSGRTARLETRAMQVLMALAQAHGQFVSRDQLFARVWGDRPVTDDSLTGAVKSIRRALSDDPRQPTFIETRKNVGYRLLVPPVRVVKTTPLLVAAAALMLAVAMLIGTVGGEQTDRSRPKVLAVLPFTDLTIGDASPLSDVITDALIMRFGQQPGLRVVARASVQPLATESDLKKAAESLGADLLVTGTILRSGTQVRVNARIIDPASQTQLWARQFDRPLADVMGLQDELGSTIAMQIGAAVHGEPSTVAMTADAIERLLKARFLMTTGHTSDLHQAKVEFSRLIEEYPQSSRSLRGLAETELELFKRGETDLPGLRAALALAIEAERLGGEMLETHRLIGQSQLFAHYDFVAAERRYQQALAINPGDVVTHRRYAWLMVAQGRYTEAIRTWAQIRKLDPASFAHADFAYLKMFAGQVGEALADFEALGASVEFGPPILRVQFIGYHVQGDEVAADLALRRLAGQLPALEGLDTPTMDRATILREILTRQAYGSPVAGAGYAAMLNENTHAIALLRQAVEQHDPFAIYIDAMPEFASLRNDPRFVALLAMIDKSSGRYLASN